MQWEIGIDMGTAGVRMAQRENGVLFAESATLAYYTQEKQPFAWGDAAQRLSGRTPPSIKLRAPMMSGVLEDAQAARFWLQQLTQQAAQMHRNRRGTVLMSYTAGSRAAHEEALMRTAVDAGAAEVGLVRSDVAGAIGAGLDVLAPGASFVLEIGAGHITATIITLGRIAASDSLPYGFDRINEQFKRTLVAEKGFAVGDLTAENVKRTMGAADDTQNAEGVSMTVTGFDLKQRNARSETLCPADVRMVVEPVVKEIVFMLNGLVAQIPEELAADLIETGLVVIGGGAQLPGLDRVLGEALEIPCRIAEMPETAVVRGLYEIIRRSNYYDALVTDRMARKG